MNRRQMATAMVIGGAAVAVGQREARQPSALAGGWASLELINPLEVMIVDVPTMVDAQILQHGVRPNAGFPAAIRFIHETSGEEEIVRLDVISRAYAIVRGEVSLTTAGTYRMQTSGMGPEIELGQVEAIEPEPDDVISQLVPMPEAVAACASGDTAGGVTTDILDRSFADPTLEVAAGTTVTWVNTSSVPHNVVFDDLSLDSSPVLHQDDTFSTTFARAGEFPYICSLHPNMTGRVRVGGGEV